MTHTLFETSGTSCFGSSGQVSSKCYCAIVYFLFSISANAQQILPDSNFQGYNFTAVPALDWTALMERTSGWFGADGIFSIPLDGRENQQDSLKNTLFIFSDTFIGEVVGTVPKPDKVMVNNSTAWLHGLEPKTGNIDFEFNTNLDGTPISYFIPDNENALPNEYYWLGDGFINHEMENALYLFAYHVHKTGANVFDFEQTNVSILKIEEGTKSGIKRYSQFPTGLGYIHPIEGRVYFGSGIFVNTKEANAPNPDGYVYIYGIMERRKSLIAARVKPAQFENIDLWEFWDGQGWVKDQAKVASIIDGVSNELSVSPAGDGNYFLTCTILGLSDKIGVGIGTSPVGPFPKLIEVYTCPEFANLGLFTYNAKAHYHLSKPGELLVSYNTITLDFWNDINKDATIYHPRFIRINYEFNGR